MRDIKHEKKIKSKTSINSMIQLWIKIIHRYREIDKNINTVRVLFINRGVRTEIILKF